MGSDIVIRAAVPDDAAGIATVHIASWKAAYANLLPAEMLDRLDIAEREPVWRERLHQAEKIHLRAWVATKGGETIGFATTGPSPDGDLPPGVHELSALYLIPSMWRRGIGSRLLAIAEESLKTAGVRELVLWVLEGNDGAKAFYEGQGWKTDKRDPSFREFETPAVRYTKTL